MAMALEFRVTEHTFYYTAMSYMMSSLRLTPAPPGGAVYPHS